jgi:radical SAM superfamily enzyme YgiQ (UPF0313 family)
MIDVAIVSLPRLDLTRPAIAPAILSSLADKVNLKSKIFDFALATYDRSTKQEWQQYELLWQIDLNYELEETLKQKLDSLFEEFVDELIEHNPSQIAISVFSHNSLVATELFLQKLRLKTQAKIIIGGQGIQSKYNSKTFAEDLHDRGMIDFYLSGEAETTFAKVLNGETTGPGINNFGWKQLDNLDETPLPNYKDYDLDRYHHLTSGKSLWINASRGCVRRCDFCDIGRLWKKFRFRSGHSLYKEIKTHMIDHKIKSFNFADALINGSLKAFTDMNREILKGIEKHEISRPLYGGHFIVRPSHQMTEIHYKEAAMAGMDLISVGIETGSDELRFRMNKKFTNDDLEHHLEMCYRYGVKNLFLMFSGHPTETLDDHRKTLEMFKRFRKYAVYGTISGLECGSAAIIHDTPLAHWAVENKLNYDPNAIHGDNRLWYNPNNPTLTVKERVRRQLELYETAIENNWPINHVSANLRYMKALLKRAKSQVPQYF